MPLDPDFAGKLDGDMRQVLERLEAMGARPLETLSAEEARRQPSGGDAVRAILREQGRDEAEHDGIATRDFDIPGPLGDIAARLYGPEAHDAHAAEKRLPVVVFYHGGGWVIGGIDAADASARAIARRAGCIVVSCSYRLAPEHRFPAAHDDAFWAYSWVVENAAAFGGDPLKVAVMGESAGANLALNVAARARDTHTAAKSPGLGEHGLVKTTPVPVPAYMVLVYPVAGVNMDTPSYRENAQAMPLNRPRMAWFFDQATETDGDRTDSRLDLVNANLAGLPDATVILAELDPLRSEGEALAKKLEDAGAEVRQHTFKGVTHTFFGMAPVVKKATAAQELAAHNLKRAFGTALLPI